MINEINPWLEKQIKKSGLRKSFIAKNLCITQSYFSYLLRNTELPNWQTKHLLKMEELGIITLESEEDEQSEN